MRRAADALQKPAVACHTCRFISCPAACAHGTPVCPSAAWYQAIISMSCSACRCARLRAASDSCAMRVRVRQWRILQAHASKRQRSALDAREGVWGWECAVEATFALAASLADSGASCRRFVCWLRFACARLQSDTAWVWSLLETLAAVAACGGTACRFSLQREGGVTAQSAGTALTLRRASQQDLRKPVAQASPRAIGCESLRKCHSEPRTLRVSTSALVISRCHHTRPHARSRRSWLMYL